jgi:hypothetical protein
MTMRSLLALAIATIFGLFLLATFADQSSAVPVAAEGFLQALSD